MSSRQTTRLRLIIIVLAVMAPATLAAIACDGAGEAERGASAVAEGPDGEGRPDSAVRATGPGDSATAAGDTADAFGTLLRRADTLIDDGEFEDARARLDEALARAGDDPVREARVRDLLSLWYERQGRFDRALAEAERTLELGRATGDRLAERDGLNALGRIYSLTGRDRDALEVHERYLALTREIGTREDVALALNEIGIDYRRLGRYADATRAYREALAIYRETGNRGRIALVSYNLANIHFDSGDLDEAARLYTVSLRAAEEVGTLRGQGFAHNALGAVYSETGNAEAAREHFQRALEIRRRLGNPYGLALTLINLGELELDEGRLDAADARLTAALAVADSAGFPRERASAHAGLARVAARTSDREGALSHSRLAVAIADSLADPGERYEALEARGLVLERLGRDDAALATYREAIDLLESWRGRVALGDLRLGVTRPRLAVYEGAIRLTLARDRPGEAFEVGERARARLLLDLVAGAEAPPAEATREDRLRRRLRDLYSRWEDAAPEERSALDAEMRRVGNELAALQEEVRRADPARGAARYPRPAALPELQAALADEGATLLAYFRGDRDIFGWRVSPSGVTAARLGAADSLAALVGFLRGMIEREDADVDWRPAARRAYDRLVAPLAMDSTERVWIVTDGELAYLPFEVLIGDDGAAPWGATRRLSYGPSASVLRALRRASPGAGRDEGLLAVGDPEPDGSDQALPPLPYSEVEARELGELFGRDADVLTGGDATVEGWLGRDPGRYRYLHFATHAVVSDRRPAATHLAFTDGRLDLAAIRRLRLRTELVTLSACETGLGERVRGEGVIGLPHAFLAAGARGVVVSLWRVRDRSAADFMTRFYRELRAGRTPAEALTRVRRGYLEAGGPRAHPAHWAAFVLVGGAGG